MAAHQDLSGQLGRYTIQRKIGVGGMGAVYLAEDTSLGRKVALKVPHFDTDEGTVVERFKREARLAAGIDHPNLCPVFDVDKINGILFFTMPYIEGTPLSRLGDRGNPWPAGKAIDLVGRISLAVAYLHKRGIIHRDLKPSNIMVRTSGDPVLMDFGLARSYTTQTQQLTSSGAPMGSPAYMAPEQVSSTRTIGPAADVYGLGMILYELLTGRPPFHGPLETLYYHILNTAPAAPSSVCPGLDPRIDAVILKALSKKPEQRHAGAEAFAAELAALSSSPPTVAPQVVPATATLVAATTQPVSATPPPPALPLPSEVATILPQQPMVAPARPRIDATPPPPPRPAPAPTTRRVPPGQYYVRSRGKVSGPFNGEQLQSLFDRGVVARFHEISTDNSTWMSAATLLGLNTPAPSADSDLPLLNEYTPAPGSRSRPQPDRTQLSLSILLLAGLVRAGGTLLGGVGIFLGLVINEMPVLAVSVFVGLFLVLFADGARMWALYLCRRLPVRLGLRHYDRVLLILAGVSLALTLIYAIALPIAGTFSASSTAQAVETAVTGGMGALFGFAVFLDWLLVVFFMLVMRVACLKQNTSTLQPRILLYSMFGMFLTGGIMYLSLTLSQNSPWRDISSIFLLGALAMLLLVLVWQVYAALLLRRMRDLLSAA